MKKIFKVIFLLLIVFFGIVVFMFLNGDLMIFRIQGTSMVPLLHESELVLSIKLKEYKTKDVIVYNYNNTNVIKRVIGVPRDSVNIHDNKVFVNNKVLEEDYISVDTKPEEVKYPFLVSDDEYFVLGDNRIDSYDSRFFKVKGIKSDNIGGKVFFSISKFRIVR